MKVDRKVFVPMHDGLKIAYDLSAVGSWPIPRGSGVGAVSQR